MPEFYACSCDQVSHHSLAAFDADLLRYLAAEQRIASAKSLQMTFFGPGGLLNEFNALKAILTNPDIKHPNKINVYDPVYFTDLVARKALIDFVKELKKIKPDIEINLICQSALDFRRPIIKGYHKLCPELNILEDFSTSDNNIVIGIDPPGESGQFEKYICSYFTLLEQIKEQQQQSRIYYLVAGKCLIEGDASIELKADIIKSQEQKDLIAGCPSFPGIKQMFEVSRGYTIAEYYASERENSKLFKLYQQFKSSAKPALTRLAPVADIAARTAATVEPDADKQVVALR